VDDQELMSSESWTTKETLEKHVQEVRRVLLLPADKLAVASQEVSKELLDANGQQNDKAKELHGSVKELGEAVVFKKD